MKNKYNLTREENIFLAKKLIVDSIWKNARMEGINITFPETQVIYDQGILNKLRIDDIEKIINLKHAWHFILNTVDESLNLEYISKVNYEVARGESLEWGVLRTGKVGIVGTDWEPPIPEEKNVESILEKYSKENPTEEGIINRMLWMMKSQLFWDGNKRTSMIVANKEMIKNGFGLISIDEDNLEEFNKKLQYYYTTDNDEPIKQFLISTSIKGIIYPKKEKNITKPDLKEITLTEYFNKNENNNKDKKIKNIKGIDR